MMSRAPTRRMILSSARVLTLAGAAACTLTLAAAVSGGGDDPAPVEAPAAFDEQSNGFETQEKFKADRETFTEDEEAEKDGLGPVYNATSCVSCHQNPIIGGSSQIAEIRAGHHIFDPNDPNPRKVRFVEALGGSVIQQRAINPEIQEVVQPEDNVRTFRMSNSILGNGFVEVIPDEKILEVRDGQYRWGMQGFAVVVPVAVEARKGADGKPEFTSYERIGRFGWKCQEASLLNFSAGAYITEMGITNPMQPDELTSNGRDVKPYDISKKPDPEDVTEEDGEEHLYGVDVEAFTRFMRATKAPPRDEKTVGTPDVVAGEALFRNNNLLGCAVCHQPDYTTPPVGTAIRTLDGTSRGSDMATVPEGLGGKIIHPYSDFLLHDIGTGDGIAQTQHADLPPRGYEKTKRLSDEMRRKYRVGRVDVSEKRDRRVLHTAPAPDQPTPAPTPELDQRTANKIRTAPLWGLRVRPQLMHDGLSMTIEDAIRRHAGQAEGVRMKYETLSGDQKRQLLAFLKSL